ncbi:SPOR domain-containing protein [Cupriavidus campinensis]
MSQKGLTFLSLILLPVNALLLAAVLGVFGPEPLAGWLESPREPQRVAQQMRGERMMLEPPADTPAAGSPRGALPGNRPGSVTLAIAKPAAPADACVEIGGFTAQAVSRAKEDLAAIAAGAALPVEQFERTEQVRWWVHLPAQPTRELADRKLAELKRRKITDVSVVASEAPDSEPSYTVSLGLFRERERADRFLETLRAQGVRTAMITDAPRPVSRQWLRVKSADDAVRARMDEVRLRYAAESLQACRAGTQARGGKQPGAGAEG